ncbi:hypothetical protein VTI74DRAFT_4635 [Chaetomium olivicolor]
MNVVLSVHTKQSSFGSFENRFGVGHSIAEGLRRAISKHIHPSSLSPPIAVRIRGCRWGVIVVSCGPFASRLSWMLGPTIVGRLCALEFGWIEGVAASFSSARARLLMVPSRVCRRRLPEVVSAEILGVARQEDGNDASQRRYPFCLIASLFWRVN